MSKGKFNRRVHGNQQNQQNQQSGQGQGHQGGSVQCSICKKQGHTAQNCRSGNCQLCRKQGHIAQDCKGFCSFCQKPGHNASNCHHNPNRQTKQQRGGGSQTNSNDQCTNCNQFGHVYSNCAHNHFMKSSSKAGFCSVCNKYGHLPSNCPRPPALVNDRYCMYCQMGGHMTDECRRLKVDQQQKLAARSKLFDELMRQYENNQNQGGGGVSSEMRTNTETGPSSIWDPNSNHIHTSQLSYRVDSSGDVVMEDICAGCQRAIPTSTLLQQQQERISELSQKLGSVDNEWKKQVETIKEQFRREFEQKYYETRQQLHDQEVQQRVWEYVAPWFVRHEQELWQLQNQIQNSDGSFPRWK